MAGEWLNGLDFAWMRPTQPDGRILQAMELGMRMKHAQVNNALAIRESESKVKLLETQAQLRLAEITAYEQTAEGNAQLATALSETAGKWTEPESKSRFWGIASRYPQVMKSPQFKELVDNFQLADTALARKQYLDAQIGGREDLEDTKFGHRQALQDEKYTRLAELQEDSQEARTMRDEIIHGYNLERDAKKPNTSGQKKYDMPYSIELKYRAKLNAINKDLDMKPEDRQKQIEAVYREMKSQFTLPSQPSAAPAKAAVPAKRIRVKAPNGTFGHIPEDQLEEAKRNGYTLAE